MLTTTPEERLFDLSANQKNTPLLREIIQYSLDLHSALAHILAYEEYDKVVGRFLSGMEPEFLPAKQTSDKITAIIDREPFLRTTLHQVIVNLDALETATAERIKVTPESILDEMGIPPTFRTRIVEHVGFKITYRNCVLAMRQMYKDQGTQ